MSNKPRSTLILYPGGAYGRYLHWLLTTLLSDDPVIPPFNNNGNSHQFKGNVVYFEGAKLLRRNGYTTDPYQLARGHPKIRQNESIIKNVNIALESFDRVVLCYPDYNSVLLVINNQFDKIWDNWFDNRLKDPSFASNLYNNWPVANGATAENIPLWIQREILSYDQMPSWYDETGWFLPDTLQHPLCKFVFVNDLLYQFEECITGLKEFCGLEFKKDISELVPYHNLNLSLQKYLDQDAVCNRIVESITGSESFQWEQLPLPSQSWVQWQLRNLGYELRCDGLDIFPTTTVQLQNLLYKL